MERHFQDKLQQFSATPPEGVWNKIADALDAEENFSQRLYQFEEQPPAAAWIAIEKNLEEAAPAKLIPFSTRFRKPLRLAAVASVLAAVLITVTLTVKRTEAGAIDAGSNTTVPTAKTSPAATNQPNPETSIPPTPEATVEQPAKESRNQSNMARSGQQKQETEKVVISTKGNTGKPGVIYSSLNEYVMFKDGDGKQRKVSKKMADFVNCKDDDLPCKQRLKQLRQKMAARAMTTDFMGILDMLRQLQ
jgi:negative regulator of sigma E activity